mmetsp:Transcript_14644/g.59737  ORF Transcript_14644/g.59737 Transcript_14644/m.59737 type:complete len:221 (-) Transcript_14644:212-874(-)
MPPRLLRPSRAVQRLGAQLRGFDGGVDNDGVRLDRLIHPQPGRFVAPKLKLVSLREGSKLTEHLADLVERERPDEVVDAQRARRRRSGRFRPVRPVRPIRRVVIPVSVSVVVVRRPRPLRVGVRLGRVGVLLLLARSLRRFGRFVVWLVVRLLLLGFLVWHPARRRRVGIPIPGDGLGDGFGFGIARRRVGRGGGVVEEIDVFLRRGRAVRRVRRRVAGR